MINSLILRKYSPKNMLKGEDFLEKETNSIHNALFLPVTIVSSFVYYAAHTNIENKNPCIYSRYFRNYLLYTHPTHFHLPIAKTLSSNNSQLSI